MKENTLIAQLHGRLREFHAQAPEESVLRTLLRLVEDPLKPRGETGRFRPNLILVLLTAILALSVGTFLIFSLGG
jgi:hypothetical protein